MKAKGDGLAGAKIRAARKAAGLTQPQVAEVMGCRQKDISRWENGRPMLAETLKRLAAALGCSVDELL